MKKILIILLSLLFLIGCNQSDNNEVKEKTVENNEIKKEDKIKKAIDDLDHLIENSENIHVNMYQNVSKKVFLEDVKEAKKNIKTGGRVEFYQVVAPLFAKLNANISIVPLDDYFKHEIKNGRRFFPFDLYIKDGKIFVKNSYTENEIKEGSEIIAINGKESNDVLSEMLIYFEGINEKSKYRSLELEFPRLYYILNGNIEEYNIKYILNNTVKEINLKGAGLDNIVKKQMPKEESYTTEIKNNVYMIDINKFDKFSLFKRFMEENINKINSDEISKVVFDIRDNPGGDINYLKLISSYLTNKEINIYGDIYAKISEKVMTVDQYMKDNYSDKIGETVKADFNTPKRYFEVPMINKPVYVLINERTRGISSLLAAVIKDNKLGQLIGTETGTNPSTFNTPYVYLTDNLSIKVEIPYKYNIRPSKKENNSGVIPDIIKENIGENIFE